MSAAAGKYLLVAVRYDRITKTDANGVPQLYDKFVQGDVIELDEVDADRLVRANAVVPVEDEDDVSGETVPDVGDRPRDAARLDVWQSYATANGVDLVDSDGKDLTKNEIIAAVDARQASGEAGGE